MSRRGPKTTAGLYGAPRRFDRDRLIAEREHAKESETHFFLAAFFAVFFFAFFLAFLAIGRSPVFAGAVASLDTTAALERRSMTGTLSEVIALVLEQSLKM